MSRYRKLVAATVGAGLLFAEDVLGVADAAQLSEPIIDGIVAVGTLFFVWASPNEEPF